MLIGRRTDLITSGATLRTLRQAGAPGITGFRLRRTRKARGHSLGERSRHTNQEEGSGNQSSRRFQHRRLQKGAGSRLAASVLTKRRDRVFVEQGAPPTRQEGKPDGTCRPRQADPRQLRETQSGHKANLELAAAKAVYARAARPSISTASLPKCAIRDGGGNGSIIGRNTKAMTDSGCHCERSEAIPKGTVLPDRNRFVAPLLAMT